ncbi:MAG: hypothetical protein HKM93_00595 [Desulfobacteraceae bacterium]|nr:hypothetical protein [Desulfobacteraceae bacterium]
MEWWPIIKISWGVAGLVIAGIIMVVALRARGVFRWHRAIRREIDALAAEAEAETAPPARRRAIKIIISRCDDIFRSLSPEIGDIERQRTFIRTIAACYFPDAGRPELQISLGQCLRSLEASLSRFDRILQRPGIGRIRALNIRQIRGVYDWSADLMQRPFMKWYLSHRKFIQRMSRIRLVILPDPFSLLFFLSQRLVVLVMMKNLVADITLYLGRLALEAYDCTEPACMMESDEILEETLEELSQMEESRALPLSPRVAEIRKRLVGFPALMISTPTWMDWKKAVQESADILAREHFPDSARPLEEAAIGPLLVRTRSWLSTLARGEKIAIVRYIYKTRLETLFQAKDLTDLVLPTAVRSFVRHAFNAYGWLKWPWKVYRWSKRASLPGIAVDLGWTFGKKSAIAMIYGKSFDQICEEIDWVYRLSSRIKTTGRVGKK